MRNEGGADAHLLAHGSHEEGRPRIASRVGQAGADVIGMEAFTGGSVKLSVHERAKHQTRLGLEQRFLFGARKGGIDPVRIIALEDVLAGAQDGAKPGLPIDGVVDIGPAAQFSNVIVAIQR